MCMCRNVRVFYICNIRACHPFHQRVYSDGVCLMLSALNTCIFSQLILSHALCTYG